jgi:hypothetical protein
VGGVSSDSGLLERCRIWSSEVEPDYP